MNPADRGCDSMATNAGWGCSASRQANLLASNGYSVWRYRYDVSIPEIPLFSKLGASHTAEIPAIFGTYPIFKGETEAARRYPAFSAFMQHTWAEFAGNSSDGPGWPRIGSGAGNELAVLGSAGSNLTMINAATVDSSCGLANSFASLIGVS